MLLLLLVGNNCVRRQLEVKKESTMRVMKEAMKEDDEMAVKLFVK